MASKYRPDGSLPDLDAGFEPNPDGTVSYFFKVIGLLSVDEAHALAMHLKSPLQDSLESFYTPVLANKSLH